MARLKDIELARLNAAQRLVYDEIIQGPRGVVEGPLRVWVNNPELAKHAQALGTYCRYGTSLPGHLSELAIIIVGAYWRAGFEWAVHAPIAQARGISEAVIEAIRQGRVPDFEEAAQRAIYDFSTQLLVDKRVTQPAYDAAVASFGEEGVIDLVGTIGYYSLICATINAFQVPVPEHMEDPFAQKTGGP